MLADFAYCFITASIYSSVSGGNAGMEAGFAGILSFLLSVTSFGLSVEELSKNLNTGSLIL